MNRLLTALFVCVLLQALVQFAAVQTNPDPGGPRDGG